MLSLGLSCGVLLLNLTTDPIELWSNPDSITRKHKEYYDSHFEPFYRTEQIIMYPTDEKFFVDDSTQKVIGSALKKEFVLEVLNLETEIKNVSKVFK